MEDHFAACHPIVNFVYFAMVICSSVFLMHPVFLTISFGTAILYQWVLMGRKEVWHTVLLFYLPIVLLSTLVNPLFNRSGDTVLFYWKKGNPVTSEAVIYGMILGVMLCQMLAWFRCLSRILTSEKFVYLFGRLMPAVSMVLSMCLKFVPQFERRLHIVENGQKCIGRDMKQGTVGKRTENGVAMLSILVTWSLEHALETADSMKARGYGLKGRTSFSLYRFEKRDKLLLLFMAALMLAFAAGIGKGYTGAVYYPRIEIKGLPLTAGSMVMFTAYFIFCMIPVLLDTLGEYRWNRRRKYTKPQKKGDFRLWNL